MSNDRGDEKLTIGVVPDQSEVMDIAKPQQAEGQLFTAPSTKHQRLLELFCNAYRKVPGTKEETLVTFLKLLAKLPYKFAPYHEKIRFPFDHYAFGLDFVRPLINFDKSKVEGLEILDEIAQKLARNENVILLANHQTEGDPQIISALLEKTHPQIGERIIYVAGERVVTDPLAVPFSMGCDLLCIYSKRYIDNPPELKNEKQLHNKSTMELMSRLLKEGGKIIYVAPSGGRDRKDASGKVKVSPFDPQSLEMFFLMAKKAKTPTHFHPLTLVTYDLLPPPGTIQKELGEERVMNKAGAKLLFHPEFDMEKFPGSDENEKTARRQNRADAIWNLVNQHHERMTCLNP